MRWKWRIWSWPRPSHGTLGTCSSAAVTRMRPPGKSPWNRPWNCSAPRISIQIWCDRYKNHIPITSFNNNNEWLTLLSLCDPLCADSSHCTNYGWRDSDLEETVLQLSQIDICLSVRVCRPHPRHIVRGHFPNGSATVFLVRRQWHKPWRTHSTCNHLCQLLRTKQWHISDHSQWTIINNIIIII